MANRVPLVVDTSTLYIKELPTADNLDLTGSGIVGLTGIAGTSGNFSGIVTAAAFFVDANEVISNSRQLKNIASLDATTTATIESAIAAAPNDFTSLNVSGVSTFGGITTVTGSTLFSKQLDISGITTTALLNVGVGGTIITTTNTTRVGINSTIPGYTLDVRGDLNFSGSLYQGGTLFTSGVGIQSGGTVIGTGVTNLNFIGVGNTVVYNAGTNTVNISISGGGSEEVTAVSSTSATSVSSFSKTAYRSASYLAQITQGSNYQVGRYLLIHDGTTVTVIEESAIATGSMLGSFDGTINGSNVELRVTMTSASSATVTVKADTISIPV